MPERRFSPPAGPAVWHWREPSPIRGVLLDSARTWGLDNPFDIARIFGAWKEMVGEQVAARCEPANLGRGVLKVWAASAPWANELRYLAPEVIRRVNAGLGHDAVRELKVSLRPAERSGRERGRPGSAPSRSSPARARSEPLVRRVAVDPEQAQAMVAPITDERLAAATKRAVLAAKTRPKGAREPG